MRFFIPISMQTLNTNINADLIMSGAFTALRRNDASNALQLLGGSTIVNGAWINLNGTVGGLDGGATIFTANTAETDAVPCMQFGPGDTGLKLCYLWGSLFIDTLLQTDHIAEASAGHNVVCDDVLNLATNRVVSVGDPTTAQDALTHHLWAAWVPDLVWTGADPTGLAEVARYVRIGNTVYFELYITSADSNACTGLTISLPVAPAVNGCRKKMSSYEQYGAAGNTYADPIARITPDVGVLITFADFKAATDGQAIAIGMEGFYEVAP